jgi:signal transduction histidine kinase
MSGSSVPRPDELATLRAHVATTAEEAARARQAVGILAELITMSEGTEPDVAAGRVARLMVPALADGCVVDVVDDTGFRRIAAHASDERRAALGGLSSVEPLPALPALPALDHAVLRVPLTSGSSTIGFLTAWLEPGRRFAPTDVQVVDAACRHLATVIEAGRLRARGDEVGGLRDRFLAMASHELRTPIQSLGLGLSLVLTRLRAAADEVPRDWLVQRLERTSAQLARMRLLVDTLLDATELRSGSIKLVREPVDLAELVRTVVDRLRDELQWSGTPCTVQAEGAMRGLWDRLRVEIVVTNLITNAMKYGGARPIHVDLDQVVADCGDAVRLSVRDQGIGIAPAEQAQLFRPFERLSNAGRTTGFGLGLWIVRQLVEAQGGRVDVVSVPGEGSTFTVTLPRAGPAPDPA